MLWEKNSFLMSTGTPIKNGQIQGLLTAMLLPCKIAVIKIEAHTKNGTWYQRNALADFHGMAAQLNL